LTRLSRKPSVPVQAAADIRAKQPKGEYIIGAMLRQRRKELSLTLEATASAADIAASFLSEIERDQASPSVATLIRLCEVLGIPVGSLFQSSQSVVVRAEAREKMRYGGQDITYELLTSRTATKMAGIIGQLKPGAASGPDFHALPAEEELVFVVTGDLVMLFETEEYTLSTGDSLTFDPRRPHRYVNPSKSRITTAICILTPQPR
jgi:transcriptional regulator with XRE-family HTH domain